MYFGPEVDLEIVKYNQSVDDFERSSIYRLGIRAPFEKLVENVIHTFKFYYTGDQTLNQVQHEVVSFLVEKLPKFKKDNGKAFSYFSIVAKNYCILKNRSNYKKLTSHNRIDSSSELPDIIEDTERAEQLSSFVNMFVDYWDDNMEVTFSKKNDQKIAYGVVELFRKRDTIELFNKKALYIYIREMSDANTQQITKMVKLMKDKYKVMYNDFLVYGYLPKRKIY